MRSGLTAVPGTEVSAVVLNYRTPSLTWLAVRSLQTSVVRPDRIIVVDNGSPDESVAWLRARLDGVEFVESVRNVGYSAGCNLGIAEAMKRPGGFVLLVNSDAALEAVTLETLLAAARVRPAGGIFAPSIVSRADPGVVATAGIAYSRATGRMRNLQSGSRVVDLPSAPFQPAAVSGCVMLLRREVIERIGLLDERYFFSFEDIEYCGRARAAGFEIWCVPAARAQHVGGASLDSRSARAIYFATRNHLLLASASGGGPLTRAFRAALVVGLNGAYAVRSSGTPAPRAAGAVLRGLRDHLAGRYGADRFA